MSSIKRRVGVWLVNHMFAGTRFFGTKRRLLRFAGYEVGENTRVVGPLFCTGLLRVGSDCWIGRGLAVHGNGVVTIGDRCDVAPDVTFLTGSHEVGGPSRRAGTSITANVSVGDGTWICARSTIVDGVSVGSGCVVAACACVTSDVEDNVLVGGVPARKIKELDNSEEPRES